MQYIWQKEALVLILVKDNLLADVKGDDDVDQTGDHHLLTGLIGADQRKTKT